MEKPCKFCSTEGTFCGVKLRRYDTFPFVCTRERGHKGAHVACGTDTHKLKVWRTKK